MDKGTWDIDCRYLLITIALIHSYFNEIFVHGKLLHSSASRTHVTIYDVQKCQQNTRESGRLYSVVVTSRTDNREIAVRRDPDA